MQIDEIGSKRYKFLPLCLALLKGHAVSTVAVLLITGFIRPGANEMGLAWWLVPIVSIPSSVAVSALTAAIARLPRKLGEAGRLILIVALSVGASLMLIGASLMLISDLVVAPQFSWCIFQRKCLLLEPAMIWVPGNALGWLFFRKFVETACRWRHTPTFVGVTAISAWLGILSLPCFEVGADITICEVHRPDAPVSAVCGAQEPGSSLETACKIERFFSERMQHQRVARVDQCALRIYWNPSFCAAESDERRTIEHVNLRFVDTMPETVNISSSWNGGSTATWSNIASYQPLAAEFGELAVNLKRSTLQDELRVSSALIDAGLLEDGHYSETIWCSGESTLWPRFNHALFIQFSSREDAEQLVALLHRYKSQSCE